MIKRIFDISLSLVCLIFLGGIIMLCFIIATIDTKSFGLFVQNRIGQHASMFKIFKIKTVAEDSRNISKIGRFLRSSKLDELPQLINVLIGQMSFVGPRPDIVGYADILTGDDRIILNVKPGITGLGSLKYRNEEALLRDQINPNNYNDEVIWPDKIRINSWYVKNRNLQMDLLILFYTIIPVHFNVREFMNNWK